MVPEGRGAGGHPLRRPAARAARGQGRRQPADPGARHPRDRPRRRQRRGDLRPRHRACRASRSARPTSPPNRRMKTTRVGGGHPGYLVRQDPCGDEDRRAPDVPAGPVALHGRADGRRLRDATASTPTTARSATSRTSSPARTSSATPTCSAASAPGRCTRSRSTSPRRSSRPKPAEVAWAKRVVEEMGEDGRGAVMIDGKMQDDATYKQCKVVLDARHASSPPATRTSRRPTRL